jgi:hypothetical protein
MQTCEPVEGQADDEDSEDPQEMDRGAERRAEKREKAGAGAVAEAEAEATRGRREVEAEERPHRIREKEEVQRAEHR